MQTRHGRALASPAGPLVQSSAPIAQWERICKAELGTNVKRGDVARVCNAARKLKDRRDFITYGTNAKWSGMTDSSVGSVAKLVAEKWGFGMAPPKVEIQRRRVHACQLVLDILIGSPPPVATQEQLAALSEAKGLFNRVVREDQWDWFTVCGQLGYPSRRISSAIALEIAQLRSSLLSKDEGAAEKASLNLPRLPARRCLAVFVGQKHIVDEPGAGWVYILSTRELPKLLKIGMTTRTVEKRAQEINAATGVAIPFGVRRCWRVSDPARAETLVHQLLGEHRLRGDREFFQISFADAAHRIEVAIRGSGLQIRTLDALAALS